MTKMLLQCVGDCFHRTVGPEGMHCLGAVTGGTPSPNGNGSRGGILSVYRALGVLVCEGRIQGPPRGYKEGPHCAPPMQSALNDHVCEQENYLCDRYLVLIREITDRTAEGSYLCVEVLLCTDCPCGLAKATSKNPISTVPSLSISPWQHTSEMLLEYWCICVVPNKGPETMNFQGLYQAVRSRLHFSQVAAWWSRSNGSEPSYIATRVVPYNEDTLVRFRETPVEHTFPLAGNVDGNSIKVTVWALPRMQDVPILSCPLHPAKEKDEECVARALTPTKAIPVPTASQNPETLVLPALVDDRLQTPCNKPGKHHCRCEEEDGSPPSPSIPRPTGERKRRRSLPCGPADPPGPSATIQSMPTPLPSVQESIPVDSNVGSSHSRPIQNPLNQSNDNDAIRTRNNLNVDNLENRFRAQLNIEGQDCNVEKRYKRTLDSADGIGAKAATNGEEKSKNSKEDVSSEEIKGQAEERQTEGGGSFMNYIPFNTSLPWSFVESWNNSTANGKSGFQNLRAPRDVRSNDPSRFHPSFAGYSRGCKEPRVPVDPYRQASPFHESNPGPSTYYPQSKGKFDSMNSDCTVHRSSTKSWSNKTTVPTAASPGKDGLQSKMDGNVKMGTPTKELNQLMSKLALPEEKERAKEEGGFLDWFSRVPGRMLGVTPNHTNGEDESRKSSGMQPQEQKSEVKFKNGNLELSQREFDEVLAVLRARTPSGRKRAPVRAVKRRENRFDKLEDGSERVCARTTGNSDGNECRTHFVVNRAQVEACHTQDTWKNGAARSMNCEDCCKECARKTWKKNDQSVGFRQSHCAKCIHCNSSYRHERSVNSKLANRDEKFDNLEKRSNNPVECLQNVSNKADVLLGAILRTSRERKGHSNISNGTRPRTTFSPTSHENQNGFQSYMGDEKNNRDSRIDNLSIPATNEDEKSLPQTLNKKFNRFRQLFKKEQEKRMTQGYPEEPFANSAKRLNGFNTIQPGLHESKSKVKRKIDFTNFHDDTRGFGKTESLVEASTNNAHQNSRKHSTNSEEDGGNCEESCSDGIAVSMRQKNHPRFHKNVKESNVDLHGEYDDQKVPYSKIRRDAVSSKGDSTPITSQNGYSSSKARSTGYGDDTSADEEDETHDKSVPSAIEQERFRRSLENAASMVFHSRTGLPLTSSPAPLRRGSCCFDYDSSLNSVSSKRSALFELNTPPSPGAVSLEETDRETENAGEETAHKRSSSRNRPQSHALLGSFEESALNGRLEPVSTVHGFTAELGASGSFCPKHRKLPVTVFFYTLGDNDKVSTPYLAHINLGKKGYQVPRSGTIQVTLLNPLGTVVKMFVVLYDLSDMPPRSHTFLRQRTLRDKTLRYLVHLRFMSGKSGRIYLHTDIRMIICRKSDVDTASDFGSEPPKELRSYIHGPTNPKFSPRC